MFLELLSNRPFVRSILMHYILFVCLYILIRIAINILFAKNIKIKKEMGYFIGALYFMLVLGLTLSPIEVTFDFPSIQERIQLVPFDTVPRYLDLQGEYSIYNIIGNIILFFPLVLVLRYCFGVYSWKRSLVFAVFFITSIEVAQLFFTTIRAFDVDDFILNLSGFLFSLIVVSLFSKRKKK